jgi:hypothetical protein
LDDAGRALLKQNVLDALRNERRLRRLRSPAESINALTVGALHADLTMQDHGLTPSILDPLPDENLPSPVTALGFGYRRSVKPDVVAAGGRQPMRAKLGSSGPSTVIQPASGVQIPLGLRAAHPGSAMDRRAACYSRGTSTATALVSRTAGFVLDTIERLREDWKLPLDPDCDAALVRALVIHGASWESLAHWREFVRRKEDPLRFRDEVGRAAGYGLPDLDRVVACAEQRATAIATGRVSKDRADVFSFPLPDSLVGARTRWRLVTTLSWFSPINPRHYRYRKAHLWVTVDLDSLGLHTRDVMQRPAQRGTVEHLIWETEGPTVFRRGRILSVEVNCREDAPELTEDIPYAIAVTLEAAADSRLPIYSEIRARLRPRVRARPSST